MEILAFFAGILCCYAPVWPVVFCMASVLLFRPSLTLVGCVFLGFSWAYLHQYHVMHALFTAQEPVVVHAQISGDVVSSVLSPTHGLQFDVLAHRINGQPTRTLLHLSCFNQCPTLQKGERWRLKATLKSTPSTAQRARHQYWQGNLLRGSAQKVSSAPEHAITLSAIRQRLAVRIKAGDPDPKTYSILQALTLGVTESIDADLWALFRRTGTTHLMVISGAHIGLIAGLMYKLIHWLWACSSGCLTYLPAARVASCVGLLAAIGYAVLSGLGIPALRACVAFFVLILRQFGNKRFSAWMAWRYALAAVLCVEPHGCLMPGFYLSFIAAGILIAANQRLTLTGFKQLMVVQGLCLVGLMPLTLFVFSYASLNGFVANLIAIPWVSMLITPLGLLAVVCSGWLNIDWLLWVLHLALCGLLRYLQWIDTASFINLNVSLLQLTQVLGIFCVLNVLFWLPLPRLFPACVVLLFAALCPRAAVIPLGDAEISVLDVGQGLAVVVRTAKHVLVYDTGMRFLSGRDMAQMALIPYLQQRGVRQLDAVVISHPDLDHRGGLVSLAQAYRIERLMVDDPAVYTNALPCHSYPDWEWDGVSFHFFAIEDDLGSKNNRSCVLHIKTSTGSMLLTGDIERAAEAYLVKQYGKALHASVLLVPHHGSKTSSSAAFVAAVAPNYAVVSYGLANRYHFPHAPAMQVYAEQHIPVFATATQGLITIDAAHSQAGSPIFSNPKR